MYRDGFVVPEQEFEICLRTDFSAEEIETEVCKHREHCPFEGPCSLMELIAMRAYTDSMNKFY